VRTEPVVCEHCGQRADRRPGFRLREITAEAVFVGDELAVADPVWLECLGCGQGRPVSRASIEVRKERNR
jgi:hypothetical protein